MTERDTYAPGTPSWVDLGSPDPDASAAFYSQLFGWEVSEPGGPDTGGYRMGMLRDRPVAGIGTATAAGAPPWWTTYVSVDDADAAARAVEEAGGKVLVPPMDVMTAGRMAVFSDPGGATISVWQPGDHHGAGIVNEPGSLTWNELMARDLETAKTFYNKVFGWKAEDVPMGEGTTYTTWKLAGKEDSIGGAMAMVGDEWPAELPDHWMVYYSVADCDVSAAKAEQLGGKIFHPPTDIPGVGRFAICEGPHGEKFSIIANPPADEGENPA
jgi:predicted enzyme related to lactoylglutathione lyase